MEKDAPEVPALQVRNGTALKDRRSTFRAGKVCQNPQPARLIVRAVADLNSDLSRARSQVLFGAVFRWQQLLVGISLRRISVAGLERPPKTLNCLRERRSRDQAGIEMTIN